MITIAENIEINTPIPSVTANPFTIDVPMMKRIVQVMNFDELRDILGMNKKSTIYRAEYDDAKNKFDQLIASDRLINLINGTTNRWLETEWGLPKGRRQFKESNMICAIREFCEETGLHPSDINILVNIKPLEEKYVGINNVEYRHIYFFAELINDEVDLRFDKTNEHQTSEISDIGWFDLSDSMNTIRSYYYEKKNIVKKSFQILKNKDKYFKTCII